MKKQVTINKDLLRERERCTFNPLELTHLLDGGEEKTMQRREIGMHINYFDIILYMVNHCIKDNNGNFKRQYFLVEKLCEF